MNRVYVLYLLSNNRPMIVRGGGLKIKMVNLGRKGEGIRTLESDRTTLSLTKLPDPHYQHSLCLPSREHCRFQPVILASKIQKKI